MGAAVALIERIIEANEPVSLQFLRHRVSGAVHIVRPAEPVYDVDGEARLVSIEQVLELVVGPVSTLCGYRGRRDFAGAGVGDQLIGVFLDEHFCWRCVVALGPYQWYAFRHPLPPLSE